LPPPWAGFQPIAGIIILPSPPSRSPDTLRLTPARTQWNRSAFSLR